MKYGKILVLNLCLFFVSLCFNVNTFASDIVVSCDENTYSIGDVISIYISVPDDEIIGLMGDVSYDGSVLSAIDGTHFVEDSNSAVVYLEATGYGTTKVSVSASFSNGDKNDKHYSSSYVWVEVPEPQGGSPEEMNEDNWDDSWDNSDNDSDDGSGETESSETTEETTVDPKLEKLNVTVGDQQLKVLQEFEHTNGDKVGDASAIATQKDAALEWLPELIGFTTENIDFEDNSVNVYRFDNLIDVYVLTDMSGSNGGYYVYDKETKAFEPLAYLYVGNKLVTFVDFPDGQDVPEGYELTDIKVGSGIVRGLKYIVEKKGSSLTPLVSSSQDEFYIVYGIAEGTPGFYSYDSVDQAAQRFNLPGFTNEEASVVTSETKEEKQAVTEEKNSETDLKYMVIIIALLLCLVITIVLVIIFASKSRKISRKIEENEKEQARAEAKNRILENNNTSHGDSHKNKLDTKSRINLMFEDDMDEDEEISPLDETLDTLADEIANEINSENNITKE